MSEIPMESTSDTGLPEDTLRIDERFVPTRVTWIESRDVSKIYESNKKSQILTSLGAGFITSERTFALNSFTFPLWLVGVLLTSAGLWIWEKLVRRKKNDLMSRAIPRPALTSVVLTPTDSGENSLPGLSDIMGDDY